MVKLLNKNSGSFDETKQMNSYKEKMDQTVGSLSPDDAMTFAGKFNFGSSSGGSNRDGLYAAINAKAYNGSSRSSSGYSSGSSGTRTGTAGKGYTGGTSSESTTTGATTAATEAAKEDVTTSPDKKKLLEAINAKKYDKNKFEKKDGDTIFDQITKAYVRNYEKVND